MKQQEGSFIPTAPTNVLGMRPCMHENLSNIDQVRIRIMNTRCPQVSEICVTGKERAENFFCGRGRSLNFIATKMSYFCGQNRRKTLLKVESLFS